MAADNKKPAGKAAAPAKKKALGAQQGKLYDGAKLKNKTCPKCGPGTVMAEHKDRKTCGKCNYMEKR